MDARERNLIEINTRDVLLSLGITNPLLRRLLSPALLPPAWRFARQLRAFDDEAAVEGLGVAARRMLVTFARRPGVSGAGRLPVSGPLLLLSNHPGLTDALCLFSTIPRADLKTLAADRPFLRTLPAVARSLLFISDSGRGRLSLLREAVDHLRAGGALLTFPAGAIEPDPAVHPGAGEAVSHWSSSVKLFLHRVPDAVVVPVVVQGVISPVFLSHALTRLRKEGRQRDSLAAALQIVAHSIAPSLWKVSPRVDFLEPFAGSQLVRAADDGPRMIRERVVDFLRHRERA
jgi:hypothetical protein